MALILEYTNDNKRALERWMQLKTEEGCHRTVNILRKSSITSKEIIFKYIGWVLEMMPEVGLSLFVEKQYGSQKLDKDKSSAAGS
jgi:hypothetical protein